MKYNEGFVVDIFRSWIADIIDSGINNVGEKIHSIFEIANEKDIQIWPVEEIPDSVLRIKYGITESINRELLTDMAAHGKAEHWLESLYICHLKCRRGECDGVVSTKKDPNKRPCVICAKKRAIKYGLLRLEGESGAV